MCLYICILFLVIKYFCSFHTIVQYLILENYLIIYVYYVPNTYPNSKKYLKNVSLG